MEQYFYAQLNEDNVCICVSALSGEVPELNYIDEPNFDPISGQTTITTIFVSRMIPIPIQSMNFIGLRYNNGTWEAL